MHVSHEVSTIGSRRKIKKKIKDTSSDFVKFAIKGNIIDLAVGVIVGGAFSKIVTSLVNDIIFPLLSPLTGSLDFSNRFFAMDGHFYATLQEAKDASVATLNYGMFLTVCLDFLIVAFSIFIVIRQLNKIKPKQDVPPPASPAPRLCPYCLMEVKPEATRCAHCTSELPAIEIPIEH